MTKRRSRSLLAANDTAIGARVSIGYYRLPWRGAKILLAVLFAGLTSACGQYDQRQCRWRQPIDYTFAVSDADFQSFLHDDGELDETECAALCDCLSPVPH